MKKRAHWAALLALTLAALACALPSEPEIDQVADAVEGTVAAELAAATAAAAGAQAGPTQAPATQNPQPTAQAEASPTLAPDSKGAFSTGTEDGSGLPVLEIPPIGAGGGDCVGPQGGPPTISHVSFVNDLGAFCLVNFPNANNTRINMNITASGWNYFAEFYIVESKLYAPDNRIVAELDPNIGGGSVPGYFLWAVFPAYLPQGPWTVTATSTDGAASSSTTVDLNSWLPYMSVYPVPAPENPLLPDPTHIDASGPYGDGDEIDISGKGYPRSTSITVALYQRRGGDALGLDPILKTTVSTDGSGFFRILFTVGPGLEAGVQYYIVPDPQNTANGFINPFDGAFQVR
jgi:hypothetical protein